MGPPDIEAQMKPRKTPGSFGDALEIESHSESVLGSDVSNEGNRSKELPPTLKYIETPHNSSNSSKTNQPPLTKETPQSRSSPTPSIDHQSPSPLLICSPQ